jgi:hypothetical protein
MHPPHQIKTLSSAFKALLSSPNANFWLGISAGPSTWSILEVPPGLRLAARSLGSVAAVVVAAGLVLEEEDWRMTSSALAERARAIILEVWAEVVVLVVVGSERVGGSECSGGDRVVVVMDEGLPLGWWRVGVEVAVVVVVLCISFVSTGVLRGCGEWVSVA